MYSSLEDYASAHNFCPQCGGSHLLETFACYPFRANDPEYKDKNSAECDCGWKGIVHDLVGKDKRPKTRCPNCGGGNVANIGGEKGCIDCSWSGDASKLKPAL